MPQKYRFNERYKKELRIIKKWIKSNPRMAKKIGAYKKLLIYDEKTIHEILGNDYEKILDKIDLIKKSFTNKECTAYKAFWAYRYFHARVKENKEIKYAPLIEIIVQENFRFDENKPQENYVCKIIGLWEEEAKKGNKQEFIRILSALLIKDKKASKRNRDSCLIKIKEYAKLKNGEATCTVDKNGERAGIDDKNRHEKDIEICFDFLYDKIFPDVYFWKVYCDEKELYKSWLSFHIGKLLNLNQDGLNPKDGGRKKLLHKITGNYKSERIDWIDSDDNSKFYETNFKRYGFVRCFMALYGDIFDKGELLRSYSDGKAATHYEKYFSWEKRISVSVNKGFKNWINPVNYGNIINSVLKEMLIEILENSRKDIKERARIGKDHLIYSSQNNSGERLWCTDLNDGDEKEKSDGKLITYFDPIYEIRISLSNYRYIKGIISGGKVRPRKFEKLIDQIFSLEEDLPFFECYMIEKRTGIYSSWELYNIFFEVLDLAAKGADGEKYKNLTEKIGALAGAINRIHNLELRVWMIHQVGEIVLDVMGDSSCDIYDAIVIITDCIKKEVVEFQKKYDLLFCTLLYLFKSENDWKNIMWMRNSATEEVVLMLENIKRLKKHAGELSYMQLKFNILCNAESKREPYKWFREIWKSLNDLSY